MNLVGSVVVYAGVNDPLRGQTLVIPATSGATTYNDGEIKFVCKEEEEDLARELSSLRRTPTELLGEKGA